MYTGLTSEEVEQRIKQYGLNKVPERKEKPLVVFLRKFTGLTPFVIEIATVISFILGRYVDFIIVVMLLLVNAVIGVIHEYRASIAIDMLKSKLKVTVKALRDGK